MKEGKSFVGVSGYYTVIKITKDSVTFKSNRFGTLITRSTDQANKQIACQKWKF